VIGLFVDQGGGVELAAVEIEMAFDEIVADDERGAGLVGEAGGHGARG